MAVPMSVLPPPSLGPKRCAQALGNDAKAIAQFSTQLFAPDTTVPMAEAFTFATAILSGGHSYNEWKKQINSLPGSLSRCAQKWNSKHTAFRCKECGITGSSCICVACFNESECVVLMPCSMFPSLCRASLTI